jgi:hypothetical protein
MTEAPDDRIGAFNAFAFGKWARTDSGQAVLESVFTH